MVSFESVIVPLSTALGLSLGVERVMEFCKNLFERTLGGKETRKIPKLSKLDEKIKDLENLYEKAKAKQEEEWDERVSTNTILVEKAGDPDDGVVLKAFTMQLLGFAAGILLAKAFHLELFNVFLESMEVYPTIPHSIPPWADYTLTGLLIGGGSGPIHVLIRFISERRVTASASPLADETSEALPEPQKAAAPAVITTPTLTGVEDWIDIPYMGGVDREQLEDVHRREKDPDLIVYHHTAMSSRSTFEDLVRVIKDRDWLTGYHCVILADGTIRPFCRWDRFGNHAKGKNLTSLGLAFNGNYETDPKVPFSNPDGRYGPSRPTEVQLKAGARVITLWAFLYDDIEVDFADKIIPHKKVSNKTCPGSMFPDDEFKKWIDFYWNRWNKSQHVGEKIKEFKMKPYLYV